MRKNFELWVREIVGQMIKEKPYDVPDEIIEQLKTMDDMCELAGGEIRSRQIISLVVYNYYTGLENE